MKMGKLTIEQTRDFKILLSQLRGFENTIDDILKNSADDVGKYSSYKYMAHTYNDFTEIYKKLTSISSMFYTFNVDDMKGMYDTTWGEQKMIMESVLVSTRMLISIVEGNLDFVDDEIDNLENFIQKKLRSVIFDTPLKEREVQNALETLLLGRGMDKGVDYDRETGKFMFSGREYIPDFIIPKLSLCIEVKLLKDSSKKSALIEQINADITAYSKEYQKILFVVYDCGYIREEIEFKRDIEANGNVTVIIVKQ